ncbi:MAG: hypothetical protein R3E31_01830 [Chloroflexota bacterium]
MFYSAESLRQLLRPIMDSMTIDPADFEGSIEVVRAPPIALACCFARIGFPAHQHGRARL